MNKSEFKDLFLLTPDNFTPLTRTPWAGFDIGQSIKTSFCGEAIGEAWEFSCDSDFPSRVLGRDLTLESLVKLAPNEMISPEQVRRTPDGCQVLVKLLNAQSPLSLQVHPADGDIGLKVGECGKPESWLVLKADDGAGLFLGFSRAVPKKELRSMLASGEDIREILNFVPVKSGDYFEIKPGVPHAIGPGITLLEPQRILSGQSGKTYRLWDWGRKYSEQGHLDLENGRERELHLDEGLELVDATQQVGNSFVKSLMCSPEILRIGSSELRIYPENEHYRVLLLRSSESRKHVLRIKKGFGILLPLVGGFEILTECVTRDEVAQGQPCFFPAVLSELEFRASASQEMAIVLPHGASFEFE